MYNSISFKANFIDIAVIKQNNVPHIASFVELDTKSKNDKELIKKISSEWDEFAHSNLKVRFNEANYDKNDLLEKQSSIINSIKDDFLLTHPEFKKHFYAITTQHKNFNNLSSNSILGIVEVNPLSNEEYLFIEYMKTNPKYAFPNRKRYTNVGKAIINEIKKRYNKDISLYALKSVYNFYLKNGFNFYKNNDKEVNSAIHEMRLSKKSFSPTSFKFKKIFPLKLFI